MKFDFSQLPLNDRAFSEKPMTFCDADPKRVLSGIIDLITIETGRRKARENWQKAQLRNLLKHVHERSPFWRKRIGTKKISDLKLSDLPILTRRDVVGQVESEGSLLHQSDGHFVDTHATSGSSGTPVKFFISEMNGNYNRVRSLAQFFMEGRDLSLNRTRFRRFDDAKEAKSDIKNGFIVDVTNSWIGPLGGLFKSGINKHIDLSKQHMEDWHRKRDLLIEELSRDSIGYLVLAPSLLRAVFHDDNMEFFSKYKTEMLIPLSEEISEDLRGLFCMQNIPVRGNYSSEEVGVIGCECQHYPSNYHVANSNVIVEIDKNSTVTIGASTLSRVLLTHLHSYATPFIRYDVGDLVALADCCKCGHDGPVISNVVGRTKNLVKHADGRLTPFLHLREGDMIRCAKVDEFRVRQTTVNDIVLELSGCGTLTEDQHIYFTELIKKHAGVDFNVDIRIVAEIDWGLSVKRPAFRNELI